MADLVIKDLHVSVENKEILKGLSLTVKSGERHALMGPNGNGKSTLLAAIMGNPKYTVTSGSITLDGKDVLQMSVDERSKAGLFLGMQYPSVVSGVTNSDFLRSAINARLEKPISLFKFIKEMDKAIEEGIDLIGYTTWGCIDLVSAGTGEMRKRYGFIYVDKHDDGTGTMKRSKKDSFYWYKKVIESNGENLD